MVGNNKSSISFKIPKSNTQQWFQKEYLNVLKNPCGSFKNLESRSQMRMKSLRISVCHNDKINKDKEEEEEEK